MHATFWHYFWFTIAVVCFLALDLGILNRKAHVIRFREALGWSIAWILVAFGFNAVLYKVYGAEIGNQFMAGYLIERSLSIDNIFVFILIFQYFKIKPQYQYGILFWGIIGALIFRGLMIGGGVALINRFEWIIYFFGAFLVYTGIRMAFHEEDDEVDLHNNPVVRLCKKYLPIASEDPGQRFFIRKDRKLFFTPMFIVLLVVETTDIIFAFDSIPAIFAVSRDAFIIYSSNIFAILGLRAMYFMIAGIMEMFHYLKLGLSFVLSFVGVKMLISHYYKISTPVSLGVIVVILGISIIASIIVSRRKPHPTELEAETEHEDSLRDDV